MSEILKFECYKTPFGIGMIDLKLHDGKHESELYEVGNDISFLEALEIAAGGLRKQVEQEAEGNEQSDESIETDNPEHKDGYTGMALVKKGDKLFKQGSIINVENGVFKYKTGEPVKDFFVEMLSEIQAFANFDEMKEYFNDVGVELKELKEVE